MLGIVHVSYLLRQISREIATSLFVSRLLTDSVYFIPIPSISLKMKRAAREVTSGRPFDEIFSPRYSATRETKGHGIFRSFLSVDAIHRDRLLFISLSFACDRPARTKPRARGYFP